jgi:glycosyltransferase involved in cell wall biosynthesis
VAQEQIKRARPLISVCIVSYNHESFIEQSIRSVLSQRGNFRLEVLVGVDLSTDRTAVIVRQLAAENPDVIQAFISTERIGFGSTNYQSLLAKVSGEFIAHLDGDDYWYPGKLQQQLDFMLAQPECTSVYTNAEVVDSQGQLTGTFNSRQPARFQLPYLLERGSFLPQSSMMYRAEMLPYVRAITPPYIDYHFSLVLATQGEVGYVNRALTGYRGDTTHSVRRSMNDHLRRQTWRAICSLQSETVSKNSLLKAKSEFLRSTFFKSVRLRQPGLFRRWWVEVADSVDASRISLLSLTMLAIMRQGSLELWSYLCSLSGLSRGRVYYRR